MEVYDPKYKFDELGDVAFAEIRVIMDRMERNADFFEINIGNTTEVKEEKAWVTR